MARLVLTPAERAAVTEAVTAAERATDGEIVTVVSERSDAYHDVALHYALLATLAVPAVAALWPASLTPGNGWGESRATALALLLVTQAAIFLVARLLLAWMPLRLALTPRATRRRRVRRRALLYFRLAAERRTAGREAVLLYLSADERAAEIVADRAVHAAVPAERWGAAMAALVDSVRAGQAGDGMVAAVGAIGAILAEQLPKSASDVNELPDRVIEL
jgi:putative membrane protein